MSFSQTTNENIVQKIIALEKNALERWNLGDPDGYLALSANDVTYFDPSLDQRLDGLEALKKYYEPARGLVHVSKYEMLNPQVSTSKEMAVLTFNLHSYYDGKVQKWNCTEVYRLEKDGQWKIVQTHWSLTKPDLK
ncbi:MAG: nuclear transport factor 2 family protein [Massilibacteroides sp.]|nr:nuclear transport factor 2 family protein [Massilibacteroides sp.]MDD3061848.1 nuclear transport factor 2 family protein [Massilibacteroides sp.]MDD4115500.1 nuclear transport factor 2 family protein [Massilibacteroides sp.]MDD4660572.1 nuclear transport factor 2 family protein [Massilibacteroides sp.]